MTARWRAMKIRHGSQSARAARRVIGTTTVSGFSARSLHVVVSAGAAHPARGLVAGGRPARPAAWWWPRRGPAGRAGALGARGRAEPTWRGCCAAASWCCRTGIALPEIRDAGWRRTSPSLAAAGVAGWRSSWPAVSGRCRQALVTAAEARGVLLIAFRARGGVCRDHRGGACAGSSTRSWTSCAGPSGCTRRSPSCRWQGRRRRRSSGGRAAGRAAGDPG